MRLKTGVIHSLFIVFSQGLDSYEETAADTQGNRRIVQRMFELGALRLTIAINANKLKPIVQGFEEARNSLLIELSRGGGEITRVNNPVAFDKYQAALKEMSDVEHEVDIKAISRAALKLDINPVPVQSLMILEETGLLAD